MNGGHSLLIRIVLAAISAIMLILLFSTETKATETSSQLFKLETEEATVFTEIISLGDVVQRISTASRTSYAYNEFDSEKLANLAMGIRSQNYNSTVGYKHFYSITPNDIEELLVVDYVLARETVSTAEKIRELYTIGYVETDRYPAEEHFILEDDLYVSGNIVLEYKDDLLFNRVELDYIGERIFIMTSMLEPTLEYYGLESVDTFIENASAHKQRVNGEGYTYTYFVDGAFLGESIEVKFYLMEPQSYFMEVHELSETEYYNRYPGGVDAVKERVNDYLSRGYEVVRHVNNSPDFDPVGEIDYAQLYEDAVLELEDVEEIDDNVAEDEDAVNEETEVVQLDEGTEETEPEGLLIEEDDIEQDKAADTIPESFGAIPGLETYDALGSMVTYHRADEDQEVTLYFIQTEGLISHVYMNYREVPVEYERRAEMLYNTHQILSDLSGYQEHVTLESGYIAIITAINYDEFQLSESYVPFTHETLPIYKSYRLADVHQALLSEGYHYNNVEIDPDWTKVQLQHVHKETLTLSFEAGLLVDERDEKSERTIEDIINEYIIEGYIIISVD